MKKTVKCKIDATPSQVDALLQTMGQFAAACNHILSKALESKRHGQHDLHEQCYYDVRGTYQLQANYVVRAIQRVSSSFGKGKKPPTSFNPTSLDLDARLLRVNLHDELVSISTVSGRRKIRLKLGDCQRQQLRGQNPKAGTLNFDDRTKKFYINLVIEIDQPEPSGDSPLGVDRGVKRIATDSDGTIYTNRQVERIRKKRTATRSSLQAKGTAGSKRVLKRLSGREARFTKDANHCISKKIVQTAKDGNHYLVLEDLNGIRGRSKKTGKTVRTLINRWSFFQLGQFVEYKAAQAGVDIVKVPPAYTSQMCSKCFRLGSRRGHRFCCQFCGIALDSDINAAGVIAALGASYQYARDLRIPLCCSYGQHGENALQAAASNSPLEASASAWSN